MIADNRKLAQFKPVKVGLSQDGKTQIIQGLASGDRAIAPRALLIEFLTILCLSKSLS